MQKFISTNLLFSAYRWQYHCASYGVFFTWLNMMMFMRRVPRFGKYIQVWTNKLLLTLGPSMFKTRVSKSHEIKKTNQILGLQDRKIKIIDLPEAQINVLFSSLPLSNSFGTP